MDCAIPYSLNFKYKQYQNIQWNITYKPQIWQLSNFIQRQGSHRINLIMTNFNYEKDIPIFQILQKKYPETTLVMCLPKYNKELETKLHQDEIPHYYKDIITDWDRFNGFLSLDVTDIIISEKLAFNAKILSSLAKKNNKKLRFFCNVCQSSWTDGESSLKDFFVRPEDLYLYEPFFDTVEFFNLDDHIERSNVYYEVYFISKKWFGKLKELIIGYKGEEDSRFFVPDFGAKRLNCGKKCVKGIEPTCHICERVAELGKALKNKNLIVYSIDKKEKI